MEASVSEIHRYPLRPDGFEEPLFPTRESRLEVLDHLLQSSWLSRASEAESSGRTDCTRLAGAGRGREPSRTREDLLVFGP